MKEINSTYEALIHALVLSVNAPTEAKSDYALALAKDFASGLSPVEIDNAMTAAEVCLSYME